MVCEENVNQSLWTSFYVISIKGIFFYYISSFDQQLLTNFTSICHTYYILNRSMIHNESFLCKKMIVWTSKFRNQNCSTSDTQLVYLFNI